MTEHQSESTNLALIEDTTKALERLTHTEAGIKDLTDRYQGVVFEVETPKGMKLAKEARAEIRKPRFNLEKLRKEAKSPVLALSKVIDGTAKVIKEQLLALETPIDNQIKVAERIEAKRLQDIDERLREFQGAVDVMNRYQPESEKLEQMINDVTEIKVTHDRFEEFYDEAEEKKNTALETMRAQLAITKQAEKDAAELAELRREKEEREAADAAEAKRKQDLADAAQAAVDEGQGNGSKGDAGSIFDDEPQPETPPPIEEQLMRKPEPSPLAAAEIPPGPQVDPGSSALPTPYPGRAGIVHAVATQFGVAEAQANEWIERLIENESLPF